jgi:CRISPR-associated protein Csx10
VKDSSKNFTIRLTMLSDWHVGTGAGRPGNVDKLIARDADGFPFVPAKTLNGILRDAMETLTLGLDGGGKQNDGQPKYEWQRFVESIFGNQPALPGAEPTIKPFSSILSVQPARLNQALRDRISSLGETNKQKYLTALTFIKPGVEIDEESGTARRDFLRFEEMGRSGTVLTADCKLHFGNLENVTDQQMNTIWALLVSSARLVERIGGKRRRGAGRCVWELLDEEGGEVPLAVAIEELQSFKGKDAPKAPDFKSPTNDFDLNRVASTGEWQHLEFSLTLKTPVSIVTATLGNVSESLDFIPGTYLLPHFTRVFGRKIFGAVAYGDFQVSPATIEVNGERGLPVPKVLGLKKVGGSFGAQGTAFNKFHDENPANAQIRNLREGYVGNFCFSLNGKRNLPAYQHTPKTLLMHNVVKDDVQRPTEEVGGVFSREAIAAKTTDDEKTRPTVLRGEIRLKRSVADKLGANWWKELAKDENRTLRLGRSRKDDYGLAELKVLDEPKEIDSQFAFTPDELTVYLLSDVLLRNGTLRQTNLIEDLADAMCQRLNEIAGDETKKVSFKRIDSIIQTRRVESWHEGWGFPRPTLIAMAAGSCVRFRVAGKIDPGSLKELEACGIGERRGEGYGQIRFNPPLVTQPINRWSVADKVNDKPKTNDEATAALDVDDFVRPIEEVVWREELKVAVLKIASDPNNRKEIFGFEIQRKHADKRGVPPMSQIGGLRSVVSRLKDNIQESKVITEWLKHLDATANRIKKWDKNDNADKAKEKTKAIKKLIENSDEVWERLAGEFKEPPVLTGEAKDLKEALWAEAVRSLFDACARAHKRDLEKVEKRKERQNGATD